MHPQTVQAYAVPAAGPYSQTRPAKLRPVRPPSRRLFVLGAIGHFFVAGASIAFGIIFLTSLGYGYYMEDLLFPMFVSGFLFCIALLFQFVGFLALGKAWRSAMGYAVFGYGMVVVAVLLTALLLFYFAFSRDCSFLPCWDRYEHWARLIFIASQIILGILMMFEGATYIMSGGQLGNQKPANAAGVLAIIGGFLCCTFFLAFIGLFFFSPAAILGGIILLLSLESPDEGSRRSEQQPSGP